MATNHTSSLYGIYCKGSVGLLMHIFGPGFHGQVIKYDVFCMGYPQAGSSEGPSYSWHSWC